MRFPSPAQRSVLLGVALCGVSFVVGCGDSGEPVTKPEVVKDKSIAESTGKSGSKNQRDPAPIQRTKRGLD